MSTHKVDRIQESTPGAGVTIAGLAAPAAGVMPFFDTTADRNVWYAIAGRLVNGARARNHQTGYDERWDGVRWLRETPTRTAGPVVAATAKGAVGDGVNDDGPALDLMDSAVLTGGRGEIDPGTYRIGADITLAGVFHLAKGAMLSPDADVEVSITGLPVAGNYPWMDRSRGGRFNFRGNRNIHEHNPVWHGVVGDDAVDDQIAFTDMVNSVDEYTTFRFPPQLMMRLASELRIENRAGLWFKTSVIPFPNAQAPTPQFTWDGHQGFVAKDGVMLLNGYDLNSATGQFTANMVNQSIWVIGAGAFGSALRTTIAQYISPTHVVLSQKAQTAVGAAEYHAGGVLIFLDRCINCRFTGFAIWGDQNLFVPTRAGVLTIFDIDGWTNGFEQADRYEACLNVTNGDTTIVSTRALFRRSQVNSLINIPGAGAGGGALNTQIVRYIDPTHVKVALAPAATIVGTTGVVNGQYGYGSECYIESCFIGRNKGHKDFVGVSLSTTAQNNQEYHVIEGSTFQGNSGANLYDNGANLGSIGAGSAAFATGGAALFDNTMVGKRVRIDNAGPVVGGLATELDTTILAYIDPQHVTLAAAATTAVVAGPWMLGEGFGTAVKNGSSFNAKRQLAYRNTMHNWRSGITSLSGSFISDLNNFTFNEIDHEYLGSSEPSMIFRSNSEASRQHLVNSQADPVFIKGSRMAPYWGKPNGGYIQLFAGGFNAGPTTLEESLFDQTPRPGCSLFDLGGAGKFTSIFTIRNIRVNFITEAQLFRQYGGGGYKVVREGIMNMNAPQPTRWMQGQVDMLIESSGVSVANGYKTDGVLTVRTRPTNGAQNGIALLGQADSDAVGANLCIGVQGEAGTLSTRTQFTTEFIGVRAVLPNITVADNTQLGTGFSVKPPIVAAGTLQEARGIQIPALKVTGVTKAFGVKQEGTADLNKLLGRTFQAAPSSAPADSDLDNNTISFYLDEAGNNLKVRIRKSDGTYKTTTIAMV